MRETSFPVQSLSEIGMSGGENFSPNCGENGSNSEVKSSVITPVKWAVTWVELKIQNLASTEDCSTTSTSLRSQRRRLAPANGETSAEPGNRLMKSGTMRSAPTQGQKTSTLPVSPSEFGRVNLPNVWVGFWGLEEL